jgi:hypothetical protein
VVVAGPEVAGGALPPTRLFWWKKMDGDGLLRAALCGDSTAAATYEGVARVVHHNRARREGERHGGLASSYTRG